MITALALTAALMSYDVHKDKVENHQYIAIVDFTQADYEERFTVYDIVNKQPVFSTYVAHGLGSGTGHYATSFGNEIGSYKSSLGAMMTGHEYIGKHGKSMTLLGLEQDNNNVRVRSIVIHGAYYVGAGIDVGNSLGCLAVPQHKVSDVIDVLGPRAFVFTYGNKE